METNNNTAPHTMRATITGTAFAVCSNIRSDDITKTIVLAALGAFVSFLVSLFLNWLRKK